MNYHGSFNMIHLIADCHKGFQQIHEWYKANPKLYLSAAESIIFSKNQVRNKQTKPKPQLQNPLLPAASPRPTVSPEPGSVDAHSLPFQLLEVAINAAGMHLLL